MLGRIPKWFITARAANANKKKSQTSETFLSLVNDISKFCLPTHAYLKRIMAEQ